jgi:hypothetical protein
MEKCQEVQTETPEQAPVSRRQKRLSRIAGGIGAVSATAGAALLSRNERSAAGKGLLGIGVAAGLAAIKLEEQSQSQGEAKRTQEKLDKLYREIELGRPEGSPAVETFLASVNSIMDKHAAQTKTIFDPDTPGHSEEQLSMVLENGKSLTVSRGHAAMNTLNFHSVTATYGGVDPFGSPEESVEYAVYSTSQRVNPQVTIENGIDLYNKNNAAQIDEEMERAASLVQSAEVTPQ